MLGEGELGWIVDARKRVSIVVEHVNEGDKVGGGKKMMIVGERMLGMRERVIVLWVC